jgi:hypothetical protein
VLIRHKPCPSLPTFSIRILDRLASIHPPIRATVKLSDALPTKRPSR